MAPTRTAATLAVTLLFLLVVVGPTVLPADQSGTAAAVALSDDQPSGALGAAQLTVVETDDTTVTETTITERTVTATPTVTAVETATPTATAVDEVQTVIEATTTNQTATSDDTTSDLTNTTENTTSDLSDTTENTTVDLSDTTENTTGDLSDTTENTTGDLTNTTENTTSDLTNTTGTATDGTVEGTANTSASVGEGTGTATATMADTQTATATGQSSGGQPSETATNEVSRGTLTEESSSDETDSRTTAAAANPSDGGGSGGLPDVPERSGTAVVGVLAVAGLAAAAASKQAAVSAAVTPPTELQRLGQFVRIQASERAQRARAHLSRLRLLLPFGYSQYDDSDPLEHDVRAALFDRIEREPGVNLSTLADDRDVSLSTVRHHLRILSNERLVEGEKIRGQRRYFPQNESEPALLAALDDGATEPILQSLAHDGPATVSELADTLGRDPSTISHHLSRLDDDGLIERERDGQAKVNRLAPVAKRALVSEATRRRMATD